MPTAGSPTPVPVEGSLLAEESRPEDVHRLQPIRKTRKAEGGCHDSKGVLTQI